MANRAKHAQRSQRSFKQRMRAYQDFLRSGYFYQIHRPNKEKK